MRKGNLIKLAAPAILSAVMMVSSLPVMGADFTAGSVAEAFTDEAGSETDVFGSDEQTPFIDEEQSVADEFAATAEEGYKYVYAGLTWAQYWASEGVYNGADAQGSAEQDSHNEYDKGGFDTVTRATVNHGLHRGSYQCEAIMYDTSGGSYEISYWTSSNDAVLTDGSTIQLNKPERNQITKADGSVAEFDRYEVVGLKYVPVAVKAADYEAFKAQYKVAENGSAIAGGYGEGKLASYNAVANVTAQTNGLKEAIKNADGSFTFAARKTGTDSGIQEQAQKTASNIEVNVRGNATSPKVGSYGEFIRVDITGDGYGDLGANMYAVKWDYYGDGDQVLRSFGTKFAADNWMHKSMGIQLGLTESYRCQLPQGTDGTGKWVVTVYAMGYADTSYAVNVGADDIYKPAAGDLTELKATVEKAELLKEVSYTADSWSVMQTELAEAKDLLAKDYVTQAEADEANTHLNAAIDALVKVEKTVTFAKTSVSLYKGKTITQKAIVTGTDEAVTYKSSNTKVATVSKTTGKVTAKAKGTAVITATCGDVTATYKVSVKNPTLTLEKTSASIIVGKKVTISAKATPTDKITYKSSDKKIATVNSKGVVTGIKKGTAKITVTANGVSKTFTVSVKNPTLTLKKTSASIKVGKKVTISAKATPSAKITYKSSNKKIATVNSKGVVTGIKKGTAKITVTANGVSKTFKVTVK